MKIYYILAAILILFLGWAIYYYATQPQSLSDRAESTLEEVGKGNADQAMNELAPQTRAEHLLSEAQMAVGVTPTDTY